MHSYGCLCGHCNTFGAIDPAEIAAAISAAGQIASTSISAAQAASQAKVAAAQTAARKARNKRNAAAATTLTNPADAAAVGQTTSPAEWLIPLGIGVVVLGVGAYVLTHRGKK